MPHHTDLSTVFCKTVDVSSASQGADKPTCCQWCRTVSWAVCLVPANLNLNSYIITNIFI
jgi:hypothetical protein